jgi:hypothetical protein
LGLPALIQRIIASTFEELKLTSLKGIASCVHSIEKLFTLLARGKMTYTHP